LAAWPFASKVAESSEVMTVRIAWGIVAILLVLWLLGFSLQIAGSMIHLLLVVAFLVLIIDFLSGRRSAA
jgi:hypothetical protein